MCGCIGVDVYVWTTVVSCNVFVIVEQVPDSDYTIPLSQAEVITEG